MKTRTIIEKTFNCFFFRKINDVISKKIERFLKKQNIRYNNIRIIDC